MKTDRKSSKLPASLLEVFGDRLHQDNLSKVIYATDASVYRKIPLGVVYPKTAEELSELVKICAEEKISIVPRTAGTSLAGQCVGEGLIVDMSRYMTEILEINQTEKWVRVQPGVIRDQLNDSLRPYGLFFGPNTSTANRCMLGGMVGNNSCGTTSIRYGTTRDKVVELEVILFDGSKAKLKGMDPFLNPKGSRDSNTLSDIIDQTARLLEPVEVRDRIKAEFPKKEIHRRNTGYALDVLVQMLPFNTNGDEFNPSKLIAGSEGTLCLVSEIKIKLDDLPPPEVAVVCAHFESIHEAMRATVVVMEKQPFACEVMDKTILDLTKGNPEQAGNRFFVQGDPGAILCIELRSNGPDDLNRQVESLKSDLTEVKLGYSYPAVYGNETERIWKLRAAGLGVLSNLKGEAKPIAFVEDTAVDLSDLPDYIEDFEKLMESHGQKAVYYAHAGAGELHLRPILDLKSKEGRREFRRIGEDSAKLVKKYRGSLSGEHGDGIARSEFIKEMVGEANYALMKEIKRIWDPHNIFNP